VVDVAGQVHEVDEDVADARLALGARDGRDDVRRGRRRSQVEPQDGIRLGAPGPRGLGAQLGQRARQGSRVKASRQGRRGQPAVGPVRDPAERGRGAAAQVDRRPGLLDGLEARMELGDLEVLPLVGGRIRRPERVQHIEALIKPLAALGHRHAHRLELVRRPARAQAGKQPSAAEHVDRRQRPGEEGRGVERRVQDARAEQCPARDHGGGGQDGERVQRYPKLLGQLARARVPDDRPDRGEQPVTRPQAVGAEVLGLLGEPADRPGRSPHRPELRQAEPNEHRIFLLGWPS